MSAAKRHAASAAAPADEPTWCGWVLRPARGGGWEWARVLLPQSVMDAHRIGDVQPPDMKAIAVARIEADMVSDRVTDRRGWTR